MKKEKIRNAVKELGLDSKKIFTTKELDTICKKANCRLFDVMYYLRYER